MQIFGHNSPGQGAVMHLSVTKLFPAELSARGFGPDDGQEIRRYDR
jgi:hypothetical protein